MNWRRMVYTGLVNTVVGLGLGLVVGKMAQSPYTSTAYQRLGQVYLVVGGVGGFLVGWSWEGLRQLKETRDWEESQRSLADRSDRR